jgi:hypothetical protein
MIGAILLILFMVTIFPIGFFLTGAIASAIHGWFMTTDAEQRYEGSELLKLQ